MGQQVNIRCEHVQGMCPDKPNMKKCEDCRLKAKILL